MNPAEIVATASNSIWLLIGLFLLLGDVAHHYNRILKFMLITILPDLFSVSKES